MAEVRARGVHKTFRTRGGLVDAVRGVDVDIRDGEFVVIVGPSGSGKSTFLRLIAGLELPTSGQIFIGERNVTTMHPRARGVAMVFQDYALYPHMTVRQNMSFALENLKYPRREIANRIAEAAGMLWISELLDRRPRELSGGQRQRVALGRAIVRQPDAFLFDEPLSNLDAKLRVQMRVELAELHRRLGTTSIYVTHDQVEAMTLGQRIVVMDEGEIQQVGSGSELYNQPANRFVATFIGSPPMNLVPARLQASGSDLVLAIGTLRLPLAPDIAWRYRDYCEQDLLFGIHPEQIVTRDALVGTAPGWSTAEVPLLVVENLGPEKLVHFLLDQHRLVAKMPVDMPLLSNGTVALAFNMNKLHLFDATSGTAVNTERVLEPAG